MIEAKLGLDTSGFKKGVQEANGALSGFVGKLAAVGTAFAALNAIGEGFAAGKHLYDLSEQTGVTVGRMKQLQAEFLKSGLDADFAGEVLGKLQKRIGEAAMQGGEAADVFQRLGMDLGSLTTLPADEQFLKVGEALSMVKNHTEKITLSMKVFEDSGAKLLRVFNPQALSAIGGRLSSDALVLEQSAGSLNKAATNLAVAKSKLGDFMTGFAAGVAPIAEKLKLDKLPAVTVGKAFGQGVTTPQGNSTGLLIAAIVSRLYGGTKPDTAAGGVVGKDGKGAPLTPIVPPGETVASSLQRVGGGGGFAQGGNAVLAVARTIENTLNQIQKNTEPQKAGQPQGDGLK